MVKKKRVWIKQEKELTETDNAVLVHFSKEEFELLEKFKSLSKRTRAFVVKTALQHLKDTKLEIDTLVDIDPNTKKILTFKIDKSEVEELIKLSKIYKVTKNKMIRLLVLNTQEDWFDSDIQKASINSDTFLSFKERDALNEILREKDITKTKYVLDYINEGNFDDLVIVHYTEKECSVSIKISNDINLKLTKLAKRLNISKKILLRSIFFR